jgi:spoIIIJ-associated protein
MGDHPSLLRGRSWLDEFLRLAAFPATVHAEIRTEHQQSSCWLTIDDTNLTDAQRSALMNGTVLDAMQYLATVTLNLNQPEYDRGSYTIDMGGYRQAKEAELITQVNAAIDRVRETGEPFEMHGLSSADRREVHGLLSEYPDLENFSQGQEPDRFLVIRLKGEAID